MSFLKNLFGQPQKSGLVFIVEDNNAYAKTLESFLKLNVPAIKEVRIFPVGETCLLELDKNPELIIMDYFLDSKYHDAETGLDTIQAIRERKPDINIIVLSAQQDINIVLDVVKQHNCTNIKKDEMAFENVKEAALKIF